MPNKTITKISLFVIFSVTVSIFFSGCGPLSANSEPVVRNLRYGPPVITGKIKSDDIPESSGLAASRCQANVLWTHNDSGDDAFIYALNSKGENLGTWKVPNAANIDWEDIAAFKDKAGKCFVFIGETGDNKSQRHEHTIYRIPEPLALAANAGTTKENADQTAAAGVIRFSYPDHDQDAEALMVHPRTGDIYVVSKRVSGPAGVYRLKPSFDAPEPQTAEKITDLSVPAIPNGFLTGGDISPDGRRMVICDYAQAYEYVLPESDTNFDNIWTQPPDPIELGKRKTGESICYSVDGTSIFAGSEGLHSPIIELKRLK
ncbi:hypothetical protein BH10ACI2_BH10ACI2_02220 [soil metagenome]